MYLLKWTDDKGTPRSFVAEGYIERLVIEEKLDEFKYVYTVDVL